ncbi:MAG: cell division protein FtsB [Kiritimatiellia bacterium]|jgi:cell division protein FtsB
MKYWDKIVTISWISLTVCIVTAGLLLIFMPELREYNLNNTTINVLEEDIAKQEADYQQLHKKQERFKKDPSYVEQIAHEMGMVYSHETIYKFTDE